MRGGSKTARPFSKTRVEARMRKKIICITVLTFVLFLMGADQSCLVSTGSKKSDVEQQVNSLSAKVDDLEKHVNTLRDAISNSTKSSAAVKLQYDQLRDAIDTLNGQIEEIRFQLERIKPAKMQELEDRIAALEAKLGTAAPAAGGEGGAQQGQAATEDALYRDAYNFYKKGNTTASRSKFQEFLDKYPKSNLASNARFWMGECYFKEEKFRQAVLEYDKVINDYPESNKVPDAYLKMGMAFLKLGAKSDAKLVFDKLVKDYPTTDAAKIAKKKLEELQ